MTLVYVHCAHIFSNWFVLNWWGWKYRKLNAYVQNFEIYDEFLQFVNNLTKLMYARRTSNLIKKLDLDNGKCQFMHRIKCYTIKNNNKKKTNLWSSNFEQRLMYRMKLLWQHYFEFFPVDSGIVYQIIIMKWYNCTTKTYDV